MLPLRVPSSLAWLQAVLADFDSFLRDHANCERKASALALKMVVHYPDRQVLVDSLVELAREELDHFQQVCRLLAARGLTLAPDERDPYVNGLIRAYRRGREVYLLDRLLVGGIVEARGCERFGLVAEALAAGPLKDFYVDITRSEARHQGLFLRLARTFFPEVDVAARLDDLLDLEAQVVADLPPRPALH